MLAELITKLVYLWYDDFSFLIPQISIFFGIFQQGRSFRSMHQEIFDNWDFFNNVIMRNYNSDRGKVIYDSTLRLCEKSFPSYVEELKGLADGSGVPFHKVII